MNIGDKGIELIKYFESLHDGDLAVIGLQPKLCPAGIWTEGWGHAIIDPETNKLLKGVENKDKAYKLSKFKNPYVDDIIEAEQLLKEDLKKYANIVDRKIKVKLNQSQYDALVSHTFNTGGSSTLFDLINTVPLNSERIKIWFTTKYVTAGGKLLNGLVKRRNVEYKLFSTGELKL